MDIFGTLSEELGISLSQIENTVALIDEGNTIPFIARYRKEVTGGLDDTQLRKLSDRLTYLRTLEEKKEDVIRLIDEQEKLTPEIEQAVKNASTLQEIEDIYRPFRPKPHKGYRGKGKGSGAACESYYGAGGKRHYRKGGGIY